ncbi:hypothetical protein BJ508DRAFT_308173 [Ascobolus immersus RN42]|uniref:Uncharacterized protein n=1 Tax=Ascobolus immersus RN42 TaxID=1160509 RepID=A0A3N4I0R4_ASCIM|nr:hypothetical protein BJ508DRAFT_308173 [Ascobolus immersus RN42]
MLEAVLTEGDSNGWEVKDQSEVKESAGRGGDQSVLGDAPSMVQKQMIAVKRVDGPIQAIDPYVLYLLSYYVPSKQRGPRTYVATLRRLRSSLLPPRFIIAGFGNANATVEIEIWESITPNLTIKSSFTSSKLSSIATSVPILELNNDTSNKVIHKYAHQRIRGWGTRTYNHTGQLDPTRDQFLPVHYTINTNVLTLKMAAENRERLFQIRNLSQHKYQRVAKVPATEIHLRGLLKQPHEIRPYIPKKSSSCIRRTQLELQPVTEIKIPRLDKGTSNQLCIHNFTPPKQQDYLCRLKSASMRIRRAENEKPENRDLHAKPDDSSPQRTIQKAQQPSRENSKTKAHGCKKWGKRGVLFDTTKDNINMITTRNSALDTIK